MRKMTKVVFGVCLASITSVTAWAVAESAAPKDDRAAVIQLMHTIVPKSAYDAMLDQINTQMAVVVQQGGKSIPAAKLKELKAAVQECMPYEDLVAWNADVYTKHFTRKEMDDLAAFYGTPTGKKFASKFPALQGDLAAKLMTTMATRMPAALKKHGIE